MEVSLAVIQLKSRDAVTQTLHPQMFEILLTDSKSKTLKHLPKTTLLPDQEPEAALMAYLRVITGGKMQGIQGIRCLRVNSHNSGNNLQNLFVVPVEGRAKKNQHFMGDMNFYSLESVMSTFLGYGTFNNETEQLISRTIEWLKSKHAMVGAMRLLFASPASKRHKKCLNNPAFFWDEGSVARLGSAGQVYTKTVAVEAYKRQKLQEQCNKVIFNECHGNYVDPVTIYIVNKQWGKGVPDYANVDKRKMVNAGTMDLTLKTWDIGKYPLHYYSDQGNLPKVLQLLRDENIDPSAQDLDSWAPIHYAAWQGHLLVLDALLKDPRCSPNLCTNQKMTPLHLAALGGLHFAIERLLRQPDIHVHATNQSGATALDLCQDKPGPDWQYTALLLKDAMEKPLPKIKVHLMDGSYRLLALTSGTRTSVMELHSQMMEELAISSEYDNYFTLWICSRNLQLQLKPEHYPQQHLSDWIPKIVPMMTDCDPAREDPSLYWRRDAIMQLSDERKVMKNSDVIALLFHEAYHNYIQGLYPCTDDDAVRLGGIILQLFLGDYSARNVKDYFNKSRSLTNVIPISKISRRRLNWQDKVVTCYKEYSDYLQDRERSPMVCHLHFLTLCWNLIIYGSAFFTGTIHVKSNKPRQAVVIGVNDVGIHVMKAESKEMVITYCYQDIDWQTPNNSHALYLELIPHSADKTTTILTKQATLVAYLMTKLCNTKTVTSTR